MKKKPVITYEDSFIKKLRIPIKTCPSCGRSFVPTKKSPDVCLAYCFKLNES